MGRRLSDGKAVKVTVPQNTVIVEGLWYALGGFVGMAMFAVETGAGETAEVVLEVDLAEYAILQEDADFAKGAVLDFTAGEFAAAVDGSGDLIGVCTKAADANGAFWFKRTKVSNPEPPAV